MKQVLSALRRHPILFPLFLATLIVVAMFGLRILNDARGLPHRFTTAPQVSSWMTPLYVVRNFDVPREVVRDVIGQPVLDTRRRTIRELALAQGMSPQDLAEDIEEAIIRWREAEGDV